MPTGTICTRRVGITSVSAEMPIIGPRAVRSAASFVKPTTSAWTSKSSHGLRRIHTSPTLTPGTDALMIVPTIWMTLPFTSMGCASSTARLSTSGM